MRLTSFDYKVSPETDGYDHLRIHPRAATMLGRALWHGAHSEFVHPEHGVFQSLEGYWQWLRTGMRHDSLRNQYGQKAFSMGCRYETVPNKQFRAHVCDAIHARIQQTPRVVALMLLSDVPLLQYNDDSYQGDYVVTHQWDWCLQALEHARDLLHAKHGTAASPFEFQIPHITYESLKGFALPKSATA